MLKCCRRMAKLSHAPSTANLLAQYISLKGRPVPEISSMTASRNMYYFHQILPSITHLSHREAPRCCRLPRCDPCPEPSCLARKLGLSGWYRGDWPRGLSSLPPKTVPPMVPSNPPQHCTLKARRTTILTHTLHFSSGITGHTQNVYSFLHNPRRRLSDGLLAGHIHLEYVQGVLVQPFNTF